MLLVLILFGLAANALGGRTPSRCQVPTCGDHQKYVVNSTACLKTCSNRFVFDKNGPCKPFTGCVCTGDLARVNDDATGACIPDCQCKSGCGKLEHYVEKTTACRKTCANRNDKACTCKPYTGCVCKKGLVRLNDDATGPCVPERKCKSNCGKLEKYVEKSTACRKTCANRNDKAGTCKPYTGCVCKKGLVRLNSNATGPCVPESKCESNCGKLEKYVEKSTACRKTCANRNDKAATCKPYTGCVCKKGLVRLNDDATGPCVPESKCTGGNPDPNTSDGSGCESSSSESTETENDGTRGCKGDPNATNKTFPNPCPPTCENPKPSGVCSKACLAIGCECNPGYVLSKEGKCILPKQCPVKPGCNGDPNATTKECPNACPPTCDNPNPSDVCIIASCLALGCECNPGYVLSKEGKCILPNECPVQTGCNGDPNATAKDCPSTCQPTCDNPKPSGVCNRMCLESGCVCNPGYVLTQEGGKCILLKDCPVKPGCNGDRNATAKECPSACPPTCENPNPSGVCIEMCLESGCQCNPGYVLSKEGKCILPKDCPVKPGCKGDPNATNKECPNACPPTCDNPKPSGACIDLCLPSGCDCNPGYVLSKEGKCILPNECPVQPGCNGDPNATDKDCPSTCQPTCDNPDPSGVCNKMCLEPGCVCNPGYVLSKKGGKCILLKNCPVQPGCNGDPNATAKDCPSTCQPTCDNPNPSGVCNKMCLESGCVCNPGYVLSKKGGKCILLKDCPVQPGCNGDRNATAKECPSACPPTCDNPNPSGVCIEMCLESGCQCNPGYVLSKESKCILPKDCPVKTCSANEQFVNCKVECPNSFCPVNDNRGILICDPPRPCPSGCVCRTGYLRKSRKEKVCIEASQCPPVKCTRQNEVWNPTPPKCLLERCSDANKPEPVCDKPYRDYTPKCVCQQGFLRNDSDICVPACECLNPGCNGDPNATTKECPNACPPTCDNPKPSGACIAMCLPSGCECNPGYVLSKDGKCILPNECPVQPGCNGDPNATTKECPNACPPTCDDPKPSRACIDVCLPSGCECNPGYVLSKEGKCILPNECPVQFGCNGDPNATAKDCPSTCQPTCDNPNPSGVCNKMCLEPGCVCNPGYVLSKKGGKCILLKDCPVKTCSANEQFANCKVECPNSFCPVNDNRGILMCDPPMPCPSGCVCSTGYLRKSQKEKVCIEASQCPPVKCTRQNEVWNPTPPKCLLERCSDANKPEPVCDKPYRDYTPKCVCQQGFYRNDSDICVPACECPFKCPTPTQCRPTCAVPNPPNCPAVEPATTNVDGCQCQKGYILSEAGGKCIRIEECPQNQGCNGDPHAIATSCPWACPATCGNPKTVLCEKTCLPVGCQCALGYILSEKNGKCILPTDCSCGDPCGPNGTFVDCAFRCPNQYCPKDDSTAQIACKPGRPCPPGCACKLNYKRLSHDDDRCILAPECPVRKCTRPNEVWSPCPSECLAEHCGDVNDPPSVCNTLVLNCQPKCICQEDYYRNSSGICVPAEQCPDYNPCLAKCTPTCAQPNPLDCTRQPAVKCCKDGFILSERNGKCIRIEDCPRNGTCNGDPNAIVKQCPAPCPSTCESPNQTNCKRACLSVGCECAPGYLRSEPDGQCIEPTECPGGNPCRANETFVGCTSGYSTDYCPVDDRRGQIKCETFPSASCLSGCICKVNHKRKCRDDDRCILSSECPPVTCTRPNEEWSSCPQACLRESCSDVGKKPVICNTLLLNCNPRCVCTKNHYRNGTDICVSPGCCN